MEIKVDVHTVHPSSPPPKARLTAEKEPYGSWCTPDSNFKDLYEALEKQQQPILIRLQPNQGSLDEIKEAPLELCYVQQPKAGRRYAPNTYYPSDDDDTPVSYVESPQSPVPLSPLREQKCKGKFRLPPFLDPSVPIDPQGRAYISWLLLVTFCYSYNAWCIVLRATFPYQTAENTPQWMVMDYFCDLVYLLDLVLVKSRLMFLHEGFWVDDKKETKKNYMRKLQYKFDVLSLLPLDILYIYFGPQKVILRFPRLFKLQTFWEFHKAMDRVLSSPYVVRIGKTLFYIFYLIHLNACAYYAMSDFEGLASNGWVYDNEGNAYIRCFYFATKTATSIGKNPKPENLREYIFMTAAWLMGVFVFALLIGQIRDIIATATRAKTEYRKTVDTCSQYMRKLNVPAPLQRRVTAWFNYTWSQQRSFDESKILNTLPSNMKRDVALAVHMNTLSKVQLFQNCSSSLLRDLVLQLKPVSFLPGDLVVRRGDVGHHMYIIKVGECCVMSQNENEVLATLREGSVFGEISLLGIEGLRRRTATVRSRGYSSLFALSRSDLEAALKHHKEAATILRLRADQFIRENAARQTTQKLDEIQMRKSASSADGSVRKRVSSASSTESGMTLRRLRTASALSRRRLSVLSENKPRRSLASNCSGIQTPLPTIVLSSDIN